MLGEVMVRVRSLEVQPVAGQTFFDSLYLFADRDSCPGRPEHLSCFLIGEGVWVSSRKRPQITPADRCQRVTVLLRKPGVAEGDGSRRDGGLHSHRRYHIVGHDDLDSMGVDGAGHEHGEPPLRDGLAVTTVKAMGGAPGVDSRINLRLRERLMTHHTPEENSIDPAWAEMPMSSGSSPTTPSLSARPKMKGRSGSTGCSLPPTTTAIVPTAAYRDVTATEIPFVPSGCEA